MPQLQVDHTVKPDTAFRVKSGRKLPFLKMENETN